MPQKDIQIFSPVSRKEWRQWLEKNHDSEQSVWLILYKKQSGRPTISWSDAVDEALCFGWIDSIRKPVDAEQFTQFFSKRKPRGTWSKVNKEKVIRLIDKGLMMQAGLSSIETAKQNGSWSILDEVEELIVPADLTEAFNNQPGAEEYFLSLSKSVRKVLLQWIVLAKRPETRQNRIAEIATQAAQKMKPEPFR